MQAQVGKFGEGKGPSQDVTGGGSRQGQKVIFLLPQYLLLFLLALFGA